MNTQYNLLPEKNRETSGTCKSDLSRPARAMSKVVFPEPGGPNSSVILSKHVNHISAATNNKWITSPVIEMPSNFLVYLEGLMIPLMSSNIHKCFLLPGKTFKCLKKAFQKSWVQIRKYPATED